VLIESLGANQNEDSERFQQALERAFKEKLMVDAVVAQSQEERDAMWAMRDDVDQIWRYHPVFLFDVSLAIKDMELYIQQVEEGVRRSWPEHRFYAFGHLGDGNLHIFVCAGSDDEETRRKVEEIVYKPLMDIGGSVSAEHGIGLEKKAYLPWCRSQAEIALMRKLKKMLDPKGILNPGRIFDV
jgi:FAD/FMN-containing dehydrogenase